MAPTVSQYLSKSKKDFKPKAPIRRPGAAGSSQSSVRGSVEPQVDSQIQSSQIPALRTAIAKPTIGSTEHVSSASITSEGQENNPGAAQITGDVTAIVSPSGSRLNDLASIVPAGDDDSHVAIVQRSSTPRVQSSSAQDAVTITLPATRQAARIASPNRNPADTPAEDIRHLSPAIEITAQSHIINPINTATTSDNITEELNAQGPPKRRKVNPSNKSAVVRHVSKSNADISQSSNSNLDEQTQADALAVVDVEASATAATSTKRRQTSKANGKKRMEDIAAAIVADATRGNNEGAGPNSRRKKQSKGSRKRARTPENAEAIRIEPASVTMAELCQDNRTGKISRRETALQARDEAERTSKDQGLMSVSTGGEIVAAVPTVQTSEILDPEADTSDIDAPGLRALVPTIRIVNGELIHDESSRTIDRVAIANEARGNNEAVVIVDSLSHKVNSHTYGKRTRKVKWDEAMTDQFYDGLRMFGTDFGMIAKMFPGKTRRTIKLKFTKEEKLDRQRINSTLLGERKPVDMEEFSRISNTVYRDPRELDRDMAEDRKRLEEEQVKEKEAMEEAVRLRAAEAAAEAATDGSGDGHDSSAKENEVQNGEAGAPVEKSTKPARKTGGQPKKRPPKVAAVDKAKVRRANKAAKDAAKVIARVLKKKKVGS